MERRKVLKVSALAAIGVATPAAISAQENGDQGIVGSWFGTVTAVNPPLGQFNDLISFHSDGTVNESRRYLVPGTPLGNLLETSGHGAWSRTGANTLEAFFRFLLQDANTGNPIGTDNIHLSLALDHAAQTLSGSFVSQIKDTSDNVLLQVTGTYSATPIKV
jgi:hypothetical protein